jgi:hypothetical protein
MRQNRPELAEHEKKEKQTHKAEKKKITKQNQTNHATQLPDRQLLVLESARKILGIVLSREVAEGVGVGRNNGMR